MITLSEEKVKELELFFQEMPTKFGMPLLSFYVPSSVMSVISCQLTICAKVVHTTNLPSASSGICSYPRALA